MSAHIIGIAGPSSSGKTELARQLVRKLPGTSIVSLDSYYLGMEEIPLEERKKANFDHPDSLDWPLLHRHLQAIAAAPSTSRSTLSPITPAPPRPGASAPAIS
jgi:uridine kinase